MKPKPWKSQSVAIPVSSLTSFSAVLQALLWLPGSLRVCLLQVPWPA